MFWQLIQAFIRHSLTTAAGGLIAHGYATQNDTSQAIGAIMLLIGFGHSIFAKWNAQKPAQTSAGQKIPVTFMLLFASALFMTGCSITKIAQQGDIVTISQRGFGINITASSETSDYMPTVQAGLLSSDIDFIPTSTNKIYSPDFAATATAESGYDPFGIDGSIGIAAGLSSIYGAPTTNVWVQPQTPMLWPTNSLK